MPNALVAPSPAPDRWPQSQCVGCQWAKWYERPTAYSGEGECAYELPSLPVVPVVWQVKYTQLRRSIERRTPFVEAPCPCRQESE